MPPASWNGSVIPTPRRSISSRAAWMSETIRCSPSLTRCGNVLAEDDRASGAGRRELDHSKVIPGRVVDVEPPNPSRHRSAWRDRRPRRDDDDLELHVDRGRAKGLDRG